MSLAMFSISCMLMLLSYNRLSFLQLVFGEFGLLELCRLNLFKFRIKVLKIKRKPNSSRLGPSILTQCLPRRHPQQIHQADTLLFQVVADTLLLQAVAGDGAHARALLPRWGRPWGQRGRPPARGWGRTNSWRRRGVVMRSVRHE
jgi:hypothetical protein